VIVLDAKKNQLRGKSDHLEQVCACGLGNTAAFSLRDGAPQPAYLLEGSALSINLTSGVCDWADEFVGQLTEDGFAGYAREEGLGHYELGGAVYGTPVYGFEEPYT